VGIPIWEGAHRFGDFLTPVLAPAKAIIDHGHHAGHPSLALEIGLMILSLAIAIAGFLLARRMYLTDPEAPDRVIAWYPQLHNLVYNKYKIDELYDVLFVNSIVSFSRWLWKAFDEKVIDGIVNGVASFTRGWGSLLRRLESGLVKDYALSILVGTLVVIGYLVLR